MEFLAHSQVHTHLTRPYLPGVKCILYIKRLSEKELRLFKDILGWRNIFLSWYFPSILVEHLSDLSSKNCFLKLKKKGQVTK